MTEIVKLIHNKTREEICVHLLNAQLHSVLHRIDTVEIAADTIIHIENTKFELYQYN